MIDVEKLAREVGLANQFPTTEILGLFGGFAALVLEQAALACDSKVDAAREAELLEKSRSLAGKDGELEALRFLSTVYMVNTAHQSDAQAIRAMKPEAK